jgi:hypothetical protein
MRNVSKAAVVFLVLAVMIAANAIARTSPPPGEKRARAIPTVKSAKPGLLAPHQIIVRGSVPTAVRGGWNYDNQVKIVKDAAGNAEIIMTLDVWAPKDVPFKKKPEYFVIEVEVAELKKWKKRVNVVVQDIHGNELYCLYP